MLTVQRCEKRRKCGSVARDFALPSDGLLRQALFRSFDVGLHHHRFRPWQLHRQAFQVVQRLLQLEVVAAAVFQRLAVFSSATMRSCSSSSSRLAFSPSCSRSLLRCLSGRLRGCAGVQAVAVGVFIHGTSGVMPLAWIERPFGV
jgi:hypothetical protein